MKGLVILILGLWCGHLWADTETYNARLNTIYSLAHENKCYTLQNLGLTSVEFARLRAICWKQQLGDSWAERNQVYGSKVLSNLERAKSPAEQEEEKRAAERERLRQQKAAREREALAAQERACNDIGLLTVHWDSVTKSCKCNDANSILENGKCISKIEKRLAAIKRLCDAAEPGVNFVQDPDNALLMVQCVADTPKQNPLERFNSCHRSTLRVQSFDLTQFGAPPQPNDSLCVFNLGRDLRRFHGLDVETGRSTVVDQDLHHYLDTVIITH